MTEEKPVDVMSLDKDSELAARLHGDSPNDVKMKSGFRQKSLSPRRRSKILSSIKSNLIHFEQLIPCEVDLAALDPIHADAFAYTLYDVGCKVYVMVQRYAQGESSLSTRANNSESAAKSTMAIIAKTFGFSSAEQTPPVEFPSVEDLLVEIEKKGIHDSQLLAGMKAAIASGFQGAHFTIDKTGKDQSRLSAKLASKALQMLAKMALRCRATRCVETIMATAQDVGVGMEDDEEEEEEEEEEDDEVEDEEVSEYQKTKDRQRFNKMVENRESEILENSLIQQNGLMELACRLGFDILLDILHDINKLDYDSLMSSETTPLMESAAAGTTPVFKRLVEWGADVNAKSKSSSNTALLYASVAGHIDIVKFLMETGKCSLSANNSSGHDALMEASNAGRLDIVKILLKNGAVSKFLNLNADFKESALTLAAYKGHLEIVETLLENHAKNEIKTPEEGIEREEELYTALMEASMDGHVDVAKLLMAKGAPVNLSTESFESPLTLACCGGHAELADIYLKSGANIEERNDENYTPLIEASREGHIEVVKVLLKHGAKVNAQAEDNGDTALSVAACGGFIDIMELLINSGGDVTAGLTPPIVEAAQEGSLETVEFILEKCDKIPKHQMTSALVFAADCGQRSVVELLIKNNVDINAYYEGTTALMRAAKNDYIDIAQILIKNGADVNRKTEENDSTAISSACAEGNYEMVQLLLKNGADPFLELKDGNSCLFEASRNGNADLVGLLINFSKTGVLAPDTAVRPVIPKTKQNMKGYFKKTTQRKVSCGSMGEMMSMFQGASNGALKKKSTLGKCSKNDHQITLQEIEMLQHLLKVQQQMMTVDLSHIPKEKMKEHNEISKALANVYGTNADGRIRFPRLPQRTDLDKLRDGELVPCVRSFAELIAYSWLEMERYCGHPIELGGLEQRCNEGHTTNAAAAVSAAAAAASGIDTQAYFATVLAKMNNGESMRVPATIGAINAASAAIGGVFFDNTDEQPGGGGANSMRFNHADDTAKHLYLSKQLQMLTKEAKNCCESAGLRGVLNRMSTNFKRRNTSGSESGGSATDGRVKKLGSKPYSGVSTLAIEMEKQYQSCKTEENRDMAILTAYVASTLPNSDTNRSDIMTGERLLKKIFATMNKTDVSEAIKRAQATLTSSDCGNRNVRDAFTRLFEAQHRKESFYAKCVAERAAAATTQFDPAAEFEHDEKCAIKAMAKSEMTNGGSGRSAVRVLSERVMKQVKPVDKPIENSLETPLSIACANGHRDVVELLVAEGSNIEHRDKKGFTPLIFAASAGHPDVCEILLKAGASTEAQTERTKDTPLSLACSGGRKEVVEILLAHNANKEHRNVSDYTPLSLAASGGYIDIVTMLLNAGAEINSRTGSRLGISPLMLAAMNGHKEATKLLLERGSDINAQIETNRNTALTLACFQGRTEVVALLAKFHANVEHRAKTGLTPLMEAANGGYYDVGEILLDFFADPNATPVPSSKDTALTIAADKGHSQFVDLLLCHGAQVEVRNKKGCTALWLACNGGHLATVDVLLKYNADADAFDNRRMSPLMTSFRKGHVEIVKIMVSHVKQFPSDQDLQRMIQSTESPEIKEKSLECMEVIRAAKNAQAESADKAAQDLLAMLEQEEEQAKSKKQKQQEKKQKKKNAKKGATPAAPIPEPEPEPEVEPEPEPEPEKEKEEKKEFAVPVLPSQQQQQQQQQQSKKNQKKKAPVVVSIPCIPVVATPPPVSPRADEWVEASGKKAKAAKKQQNNSGAVNSSAANANKESSTTSSVTSEFALVQDTNDSRKKQHTLSVPSSAIPRIIGRGGANVNSVREATGATIEIEKQGTRKDQHERVINVRGAPDSIKSAVQILHLMVADVDAQINDVIRNVLRGNSSVASSLSSESTTSSKPIAEHASGVASIPKSVQPSTIQAAPSTGNVWQQRMAARQEQQAKVEVKPQQQQQQQSPVKVVPVTPIPKVVRPVVEKVKEPVIVPVPEPVVAPIRPAVVIKREAVVQPIQQRSPPQQTVQPQPQQPPPPPTLPALPIVQPIVVSSAPQPPQPPSNLPAFGQFLPQSPPSLALPSVSTTTTNTSGSLRNILFSSLPPQPVVTSITTSTLTSATSAPPLSTTSVAPVATPSEDVEMATMRLFDSSKLAQIWGQPENKVGDSAWGSQLFSNIGIQSDWSAADMFKQQQQQQQQSAAVVPTTTPSVATSRSGDAKKSVPLFARTQTSPQQQQQLQQSRQMAILQQQQQTYHQQQQTLINQLQTSLTEQASATHNMYSQLAAQLLTHQETNSSSSSSGATGMQGYYQQQQQQQQQHQPVVHQQTYGRASGFTDNEDLINSFYSADSRNSNNYPNNVQVRRVVPTSNTTNSTSQFSAPPPPPPPGFSSLRQQQSQYYQQQQQQQQQQQSQQYTQPWNIPPTQSSSQNPSASNQSNSSNLWGNPGGNTWN